MNAIIRTNGKSVRRVFAGMLLVTSLAAGSCGPELAAEQERETPVDRAFLTTSLWDDGQAEVAFYRLRRSVNQYGEPEEQEFVVGTYLVKHDFDPSAEAKAAAEASGRVSAFKYAIFYEFESGSYQYKRSFVTNARQHDLRPLKYSFASFDWCSNQYREMSFHPDGRVRYLMRSDDYGNESGNFDHQPGTYPAALLPVLVRALDFSAGDSLQFAVVLESGESVAATARLTGTDTLQTGAGQPVPAERILVRYERSIPSPFAESSTATEMYWRGRDASRTLLRLEGASGAYEVNLIEHLRSAYWEEDVYQRLERIQVRP